MTIIDDLAAELRFGIAHCGTKDANLSLEEFPRRCIGTVVRNGFDPYPDGREFQSKILAWWILERGRSSQQASDDDIAVLRASLSLAAERSGLRNDPFWPPTNRRSH